MFRPDCHLGKSAGISNAAHMNIDHPLGNEITDRVSRSKPQRREPCSRENLWTLPDRRAECPSRKKRPQLGG